MLGRPACIRFTRIACVVYLVMADAHIMPYTGLMGAAPGIRGVLHAQGSKEEQRRLIQILYTADSSFSHPFVDCLVSLPLLIIARVRSVIDR